MCLTLVTINLVDFRNSGSYFSPDATVDPWSQASILLGIGNSAREWISLSSTGDLDSTKACL